jgi:pentose-5-phosphate-3-epimerase
MFKKRITNLIVFLLCAILLLPASIGLQNVKADEGDVVAYVGVNFSFNTSSAIEEKGNKVKIVATDSAANEKELYVDGAIKTSVAPYVFESYTNGKVTARIATAGEYTFTITSTEDATITLSKKVIVKAQG